MKISSKVFWGAGVLALLPLLLLVEEHFRSKGALERWKAKMAARGEMFTIDKLTPSPPDAGDNGLPQLVFGAGQLLATPDLWKIAPPAMRFAAPGKVIYVVGQSEWSSSSSGNLRSNINWGVLGKEL